MVHPIQDKYYDRNPRHRRSAAFVQTKGLAANEKTSAQGRGATPLPTPGGNNNLEAEVHKRLLGPTIPFGSSSRPPRPVEHRTKTPLATSETSTQSDVRSITDPPNIRPSLVTTPSQGNIKKKRASLSAIDAARLGPLPGLGLSASAAVYGDSDQQSPVTPEPQQRTEYGNPNKIAQFFPELNLAH